MGRRWLVRWLCVRPGGGGRRRAARLVLWGGESREAEAGTMAGEVMMREHGAGGGAGRVVCRADGFRLGRPAPVLAIEDRLEPGAAYVVLPVDRLPQGNNVVTAASLAALAYDKGASVLAGGGGRSPFEYVKGDDGRTVIKVTEEFVVKAVTGRRAAAHGGAEEGKEKDAVICSTPELRKHYELLVGAARGRPPWSPRLETIKERNGRRRVMDAVSPRMLSPARLLGLGKGVR